MTKDVSVYAAPTTAALVPANMTEALALAEVMSKGKMVPVHLQKDPATCLMVIEQSMRWGMSPFAVAQSTSSIHGKLMFEGKLIAGVVNANGKLKKRLDYRYEGESTARKVIVSGTLQGEDDPRIIEVEYAKAKTSNDTWIKQPDQMLAYHGVRVWARRHTPELMLGIYAPEEFGAEKVAHPDKLADITPEDSGLDVFGLSNKMGLSQDPQNGPSVGEPEAPAPTPPEGAEAGTPLASGVGDFLMILPASNNIDEAQFSYASPQAWADVFAQIMDQIRSNKDLEYVGRRHDLAEFKKANDEILDRLKNELPSGHKFLADTYRKAIKSLSAKAKQEKDAP
jgi:hypothetical protein